MALRQRLAAFWAGPEKNPSVTALYKACVAGARRQVFYLDLKVPDTIDGRFDLLVLHVFLVMRRLNDLGGDFNEAKQQLFDLMFADMDQSLREMGVGDMGIGKRIKRMIEAFYGRARAYDKALGAIGHTSSDPDLADSALREVLARNLFGGGGAEPQVLAALARYIRETAQRLDESLREELMEGRFAFPPPILPIGLNSHASSGT